MRLRTETIFNYTPVLLHDGTPLTRLEISETEQKFRDAINSNNVKLVKELIDSHAVSATYLENYPIRMACDDGHIEMVKLLLSYSIVNPSDCDNFALKSAIERGHIEVIKLLLQDSRVDPTVKNIPIKLAAALKRDDIVLLLLEDSRISRAAHNEIAIAEAEQQEKCIGRLRNHIEEVLNSGNYW